MRIASYYQELMDKADQVLRSSFPMSFIGMYDSGVDYLFGLYSKKLSEQKNIVVIPLYLKQEEGVTQIEQMMALALENETLSKDIHYTKKENIWDSLSTIPNTTSVVFLFYFGYSTKLSPIIAKKLLAYRFSKGRMINWLVFGTYSLMKTVTNEAGEKIILSNVTPLFPHNDESIMSVFEDYSDWNGKISKSAGAKILTLSGGNPGLLKSLYSLANDDKLSSCHSDSALQTRLKRIASELSDQQIQVLLSLILGTAKINENQNIATELERFGYIKNGRIFSLLFETYLLFNHYEDSANLSLTQKKLFTIFKQNVGSVISRDDVAEALWGNRIELKYSDWAIDQAVYSVRQLLNTSPLRWQIVTKRGQGYCLIIPSISL